MLPVLNNTRNDQDLREEHRELVPFFVSQLHGNESLGIRIPCAWRLELWPWGYSPHPRLLESTRLMIGFRDPFPTCSPKNYTSGLLEHKHSEYNDLFTKESESCNKLPLTTTKMKLPSFRQKLTFQFFSTTENSVTTGMMLFPFLVDSWVLHFWPDRKKLLKSLMWTLHSRESLTGSSNKENKLCVWFVLLTAA